jgi:molybdate transport system ATP-binding protein
MKWHLSFQMRLGELHLHIDLKGDEKPIAIIGPNGSGKTTLLRTMAGAYEPVSGLFRVGDRILYDSEQQVFIPPEERRVGYVPQGYALFPHLNVIENIQFGLRAQSPAPSKPDQRRAALEQLEKLHASHLAQRWPTNLSGGEQQKVALARALIVNPELLLLDEPLSALDATSRRQLRNYLAQQLTERVSPTVVVTQDARDIEALQAHVVVLEQGKIVQQGSTQELTENPVNDFVAEFFHTAPL